MANFSVAAIVPTIDRAEVLARTLRSLQAQDFYPQELIVVDASCDAGTRELIDYHGADFAARGCRLIWQRAVVRGAAAQRNEGVAATRQPFIWFFDDDILFELQCVPRL